MLRTLLSSCALAALLGSPLLAQRAVPGTHSIASNADEVELLGATTFVEGQLIVRFAPTANLSDAMASIPSERYFIDKQLIALSDMYLLRILDGTPVAEAVVELRESSQILYANPDHLVSSRQTFPNDSSFGSQWDKHNTGQGGGTADADIDAPEAWDLGTGSQDFVVSVIDGGCDVNHSDLVGNLYTNQAEASGTTGVDDDGNGYIDDIHGWDVYGNDGTIPSDYHGTHVNGIVGAKGNNGIGVAGVNWDVTLMPIAGSSSVTSTVLASYGYVTAQKSLWLSSGGTAGANVVATNSSFGIDYGNCNAAPYTQWNDAYNTMGALGILSAGATANISIDIDSTGDVPTGCPSDYVISVTNTTNTDAKAYAGYGATTIDLGAPGSSVYNTFPGSSYGTMSGTSMASPQVAGAVALMHSVASPGFAALRDSDPGAAALALKQVMLDTVDVIPSLTGITVSDGRLNLFAAAQAMSILYGGSASQYGLAVGGSNIGTLDLHSGTPLENTTIQLSVDGFANSNAGLMMFCADDAQFRALGGTILIDVSIVYAQKVFLLSGGSAIRNVFLPPGTVGLAVYVQAGAIDPTQTENFALTNGLQILVGS